MKKIISLALIVFITLSLCACSEKRRADELLSDFVAAYGASGIIYTPWVEEGCDGYVSEGLTERIFVYEGKFPENYAVFLNSHTDYASECGVFVCRDAEEMGRVVEMCGERVRLLGRGNDKSFVTRSGMTVFYSTMSDRTRAEKIWRSIIG